MVMRLKIVPTVMVWYLRKLKHRIHILKLPDELLDEVFKYLETEELLQMNMVCRRFNLLVGKLLWHSIFVSTPINDVTIGTPWANYKKIPHDKFMELLQLKKLKTRFMKRLVLGHEVVDSFDWFQDLVAELKGCSIAISKIMSFDMKLVKQLNLFNRSSLMGAGVWWMEFGFLDLAMITNPPYDFAQPHLIKSLRINSVGHDFFHNWIPTLTLLESLCIVKTDEVEVKKKIRLTLLEIFRPQDSSDHSEIFDFLSLESLHLKGRCPWLEVGLSPGFRALLSIRSLRMNGTIRNLPNYCLRELHYVRDIPKEDFEYILRHPITYLSVDPFLHNEWEWWKAMKIMYKLKGMSTLKRLKIGKIKYRVVHSCWGNKYIRMTIVPDTITISIF